MSGAGLVLATMVAAQSLPPCPPAIVSAEREFAGVFLDEFESQAFYEGIAEVRDIDRRSGRGAWMDVDVVKLGQPFGITRRTPGGVYRMRFVGVRTARPGASFPCGYGHFNAWNSRIELRKLIAIDYLGVEAQLR